MADMPKKVDIREEGPREGFQIEKNIIPTGRKVDFINALAGTGLKHIQTVSFVDPRRVPNMADAAFDGKLLGRDRALEAPVVEPKAGEFDARDRHDAFDHLLRVGHVRHAPRIDERDGLDMLEARARQRIDEFDLALGRDHLFFDLEPFARALFANLDRFRHIAHGTPPLQGAQHSVVQAGAKPSGPRR
ncbi:MAG: hypothetical protein ACREDY_19515 [Bradyrhizobium sp.]